MIFITGGKKPRRAGRRERYLFTGKVCARGASEKRDKRHEYPFGSMPLTTKSLTIFMIMKVFSRAEKISPFEKRHFMFANLKLSMPLLRLNASSNEWQTNEMAKMHFLRFLRKLQHKNNCTYNCFNILITNQNN